MEQEEQRNGTSGLNPRKKELAAVMERHGVKWLQKGTYNKHLSVLDNRKAGARKRGCGA